MDKNTQKSGKWGLRSEGSGQGVGDGLEWAVDGAVKAMVGFLKTGQRQVGRSVSQPGGSPGHGLGQSWPLTLRALLWYLTAFLVSDTALST